MQEKQATGVDTIGRIPVYFSIYSILAITMFPWISAPELKYRGLPSKYSIFKMREFFANLQTCYQVDLYEEFKNVLEILKTGGVILAVFLAFCGVGVFLLKKRSKAPVIAGAVLTLIFFVFTFGIMMKMNKSLNEALGIENTFTSLSILSKIQMTSFGYGGIFLSVLLLVAVNKVYEIDERAKVPTYEERIEEEEKDHFKLYGRLIFLMAGILLLILFGIYFLNDRSAVFIGLCIITLSMLPFTLIFEGRRPKARELILIAVMSTIAVVGRMAFFMVPQFKPVTAIVMITGIGLGPEAGFLTGVISGFVSNFFFGQGPWTPWQMFAFGMIGLLSGVIFKKRKNLYVISGIGGLLTFVVYGGIMDVSTVLSFTGTLTKETVRASLISGIPFNIIHGVSTIVFLLVLFRPMESKLERMKIKYGIRIGYEKNTDRK